MCEAPISVERKAYVPALDGLTAIMAIFLICQNPVMSPERERFLVLTLRRGDESTLTENVLARGISRCMVFPTIGPVHLASEVDVMHFFMLVLYQQKASGHNPGIFTREFT
jgi:hypothetical protein